jgi:glycosyltransferase involved in cell wall biosynthesis
MRHANLSVAMCTYNGERFLREQLDSIAAQTRLPDELVVCDDHSTDQTVAILNDFEPLEPYRSQGREYACFVYREQQTPFAGAHPTARWMRLEDIRELLLALGFADIDVAERRAERNGPRVLIFARRPRISQTPVTR